MLSSIFPFIIFFYLDSRTLFWKCVEHMLVKYTLSLTPDIKMSCSGMHRLYLWGACKKVYEKKMATSVVISNVLLQWRVLFCGITKFKMYIASVSQQSTFKSCISSFTVNPVYWNCLAMRNTLNLDSCCGVSTLIKKETFVSSQQKRDYFQEIMLFCTGSRLLFIGFL